MSLLPPNSSGLQRALESAVALPALPDATIRRMWDPETCPELLLPWLAWAYSVDNWDASWPLAVRRSVIANAISIHRRKGTLSAVEDAIRVFGASISIREWWQTDPPGEPGTFEIVLALADIDGEPPSAAYVASVVAEIERTKPLSRHFTFTQALEARGTICMAVAARAVTYARQSFSGVFTDYQIVLIDPDTGEALTDPDTGETLTDPPPLADAIGALTDPNTGEALTDPDSGAILIDPPPQTA